jgi:hypothetical protein
VIVVATSALRKAMHEIAAKKGDFTLFALFRRANGLGDWDLVVSAPWLDSDTLKVLSELTELLAKSIGRVALAQLARVEIIPSNNETLKYILKNMPVDDGEHHIQNTELFGLEMEEGIILRAKRPGPKKPRVKGLRLAGAGPSRGRG